MAHVIKSKKGYLSAGTQEIEWTKKIDDAHVYQQEVNAQNAADKIGKAYKLPCTVEDAPKPATKPVAK